MLAQVSVHMLEGNGEIERFMQLLLGLHVTAVFGGHFARIQAADAAI